MKWSVVLGLFLNALSLAACTRHFALRIDSVEWHTNGPTLAPAIGSTEQPGSTAEQIARLNRAQCLWKGGEGEAVRLSWRSVIHGGTIPDIGVTSYDSCTGVDNLGQSDTLVLSPSEWTARDYTVRAKLSLCASLPSEPNPSNECHFRIDPSSCADVSPLCNEPLHDNYPYCQPSCTLGSLGHGTFKVIADRIPFDSPPFQPAISAIAYSRNLSRRLEPVPDASDTENQVFVFRWGVPTDAGAWEENFSPTLLISKIRVFRREPGSSDLAGRRYMQVHDLAVDLVSLDRGDDERCIPNPQDPTEITLNSCSPLARYTPAYSKPGLAMGPQGGAFTHPAEWRVTLRGPDHDALNQGLSPSSEPYLEFVLNNTVGNDAFPRLSPITQDLGRFVLGRRPVDVTNVFRVDNDLTGDTWTVAEPTVQGRDAADYRVRLDGARTLHPGGSVRVAATFAPTSPGVKNQAVVSIAVTSGARQQFLSGSLTATALGPPAMSAVPSLVQFRASVTASVAPPWRRSLFIENAGSAGFGRTGIVLSGSGASEFQILDARGVAAPPEFNIIAPGASEQFTVVFCPSRAGFHTATVSFPWLVSAGDAVTVPIEGDALSPCVH